MNFNFNSLIGFLRYLYQNRDKLIQLIESGQVVPPTAPAMIPPISTSPVPNFSEPSSDPGNLLTLGSDNNFFISAVDLSIQDNFNSNSGALSANQGAILNQRLQIVESQFEGLQVLDNQLLFNGVVIATVNGVTLPTIPQLPSTPPSTGIAFDSTSGDLVVWDNDEMYQFSQGSYTPETWYKHNYDATTPMTIGAENALAIAPGASAKGENSFAIGKNSIAAAQSSMARGFEANSYGKYSIADGALSLASMDYSLAFGFGAQARGIDAIAKGHGAIAQGVKSIAQGYQAQAQADGSVQLGEGLNTTKLTLQYLDKPLANIHGIQVTTGNGQPEYDSADGTLYVDQTEPNFYFAAQGVWYKMSSVTPVI